MTYDNHSRWGCRPGRPRQSKRAWPKALKEASRGRTEEVGEATIGRAKELKGASREEGEWLEGVGRGGGGRLCGNSSDKGDWSPGGTNSDEGDRRLGEPGEPVTVKERNLKAALRHYFE